MKLFAFSLVLALAAASATAKTFVLPHVLERAGLTDTTTTTFDTVVHATYSGTASATLDVYLFDNFGNPLRSWTGATLCSPCSTTFNAQSRAHTFRMEDAILAAGGFAPSQTQVGFAILVTGGLDPDALALDAKIINSLAEAGDLSVATIPLPELDPRAIPSPRIIPYFVEATGSISTTAYTFDTAIYATYTAGLAGAPPGAGANVDVYLYDELGQVLRGASGDVCNPCSAALSSSAPKALFRIEDLINARGGFASGGAFSVESGFAVININGADPAAVSLGAFIINSHANAFDLDLTWIGAEYAETSASSYVVPNVTERSGPVTTTQFSFDTILYATYTGGLAGMPDTGNASVDLYLYTAGGQAPLRGLDSQAICAPCTFTVGPTARRATIRIDDLIAAHGFNRPFENAQALITVSGSGASHVNLYGLIANSHTSWRDLVIHPFSPAPVSATEAGEPDRATFVIPRLAERPGRINTTQHTVDEHLHLFYAGGLAGLPARQVAVDIYFFNGDHPLQGDNGSVCAPCTFNLDSFTRHVNLGVESHLGSLSPNALSNPYALIEARGDIDNLAVVDFAINAHSSTFDTAMWAAETRPIARRLIIPKFSNTTFASGVVTFSFPTEPGVTYRLETRAPSETAWTFVIELTGDGSIQSYSTRPRPTPALYRLVARE